MSRRFTRVLLVISLLLTTATTILQPGKPAGASPPTNTGSSLRVLAFNTAFLWAALPQPSLCDGVDINDGVFGGLTYPERAEIIAERIKQTDNDVVVLSEVFSDPVKELLVQRLSGAYPNYVAKIARPVTRVVSNSVFGPAGLACGLLPGGFSEITSADSGLMIFVKDGLQFEKFSAATQPPDDVDEVVGRNNAGPWGGGDREVAVDTYDGDECSIEDCLSSKAVAMVRILNASTGEHYNVAFSHAQAWNEPAQVAAREAQFKVMKELIIASLTPFQLQHEPVYLTGDLNVPGKNPLTSSNNSEWKKLFDSPASSSGAFFACGDGPCSYDPATQSGSLMTDGWAFDTSTDDPGLTNYKDNARLDYFIHNHNVPKSVTEPGFCLQHVMRAFDLGTDVGPLSDHYGIRADVNRRAAHCSPVDPSPLFGPQLVVLDKKGDFVGQGSIAFPGSVQWFRLDKGQGWGTNSFVFNIEPASADPDAAFDFDVYQSTDLSTPIPMFSKDVGQRSVKYSLPEPPYFIRVFARAKGSGLADRTKVGPYTMRVHENRGLSPEDAVGMRPAFETSYPWPALPLFNGQPQDAQQDSVTFKPDTMVWFDFFSGTGSTGQFPDVDLLVENNLKLDPPKNPPFSMGLREDSKAKGYPVLAKKMDQDGKDHDFDDDGKADFRLLAPKLPGAGPDLKRYLLTLERGSSAEPENIRSITTFRTTFTYIKSMAIKALNAEAADERMQWSYDSQGDGACFKDCFGPVSLDDGQDWQPPAGALEGGYVKKFKPRLWAGAVELESRSGSYLGPLDHNSHEIVKTDFRWAKGANNASDADYWYELHYCLVHEKDWADACELVD